VIFFYNLVKEQGEGIIGILRTSINANIGVWIPATSENTISKRDLLIVNFIFELVPDFLSQTLRK